MIQFILWYILVPLLAVISLALIVGFIDHFVFIRPLQQKAMLYEAAKDENIHKNGFSATKAQKMGKMDAIVIGSGE